MCWLQLTQYHSDCSDKRMMIRIDCQPECVGVSIEWISLLHLEPWYTWFQVWFHDILHIHEFIHEFIGHEMSHMNSWTWNLIWIHDYAEFKCMNSPLNSCWWIHDIEIMYEFICMNSCVNSVLWIISWNHGWIFGNEFTYEIMVEFINLKLFLIQLQISFSEGKCFTHPT